MPPKYLVDLKSINLNHVQIPIEKIRELNPQRYEMEQISGIIFFDLDKKVIIGYKDTSESDFWVRGHIPEYPIMPGVLMIEVAAQLCTYYYKSFCIAKGQTDNRFFGFAAIDKVRFRGTVLPGERLTVIVISKSIQIRRALFKCQGIVKDNVVFEAQILGMPIEPKSPSPYEKA